MPANPKHDLKTKSDDLLVIVRQDGDMLIDDRAQHEVGSLLYSRALGVTIPAPHAVPLYGFADPKAPAVQLGMAYVIPDDPPLPDVSDKAVNYIAESLFIGFLTESTKEQISARKRNRTWATIFFGLAAAFFIFAMFIYPLMHPPATSDDDAKSRSPYHDHAAIALQSEFAGRLGETGGGSESHPADAPLLGGRESRRHSAPERPPARL